MTLLMNEQEYTILDYIRTMVAAATYDAWINGRTFSWLEPWNHDHITQTTI